MSFANNSKKRQRGQHEEVVDELGRDQSEDRQKKFRVSGIGGHALNPILSYHPTPSNHPPTLAASVLTPVDSEDDGAPPPSSSVHHPSFTTIQARSLVVLPSPSDERSYSPDLDMADLSPTNSPSSKSATLLSPLERSALDNDRIPTPMFDVFPPARRLHPPQPPQSGSAIGMSGEGLSFDNTNLAYKYHLRRRRLPSPISESEDAPSPMDTCCADEILCRLDGDPKGRQSASRGDFGPMDMESPYPDAKEVGSDSGRGRAKYRHEGEGRGKQTLAMGYRADCEKCRARVPGHYSHVMES